MDVKALEEKINLRENLKNYVFVFIIFSSLAAFTLIQLAYQKRERGLLQKISEEKTQKDEMSLKFNELSKAFVPLKEEINGLKKMILVEKTMTQVDTPKSQAVWAGSLEERLNNPPVSGSERLGSSQSPKPSSPRGGVYGTAVGLSRLKDYVKEIGAENAALKQKVNELTQMVDAKEAEIARLSKENITLRDDLDKALKNQADLKATLDKETGSLKAQLAQKEYEALNLNKLKEDLETRANELNNKLLESVKVGSDLEKQVAHKAKELPALQIEFTRVKGELLSQASENKSLKEKVADLTDSLDKREKERADIIKELWKLREVRKDLESEVNDLTLAKTTSEGQVTQFNSRIDKLNSSYVELKQTATEMASSLKQKEVEIKIKQNELAFIKVTLDKVSKDRDSLFLSLRDKEEMVHLLQSNLSAAKGPQGGGTKELIQLKAAYEKLKVEIKNKQNELASINGALDKVSKDRDSLSLSLKEKEELILRLQSNISAAKGPQGGAGEELSQLNAAYAKLKEDVRDILQEIELLRMEEYPDPYEVKAVFNEIDQKLRRKLEDSQQRSPADKEKNPN